MNRFFSILISQSQVSIVATILCLAFATTVMAQTTQTAQTQDAETFEVEPGFTLLFNGKDLTGWSYLPTTDKQKKSHARWKKNNPNAPAWPIVNEKIDFGGKAKTDDGRFVAENETLVVTVPEDGRKVQMLYTSKEFGSDFTLKLDFRAANNADSGVFIRGKQLQCRDYPNAGPDKYKKLKNFKAEDWNTLEIVVTGNTARCTCNGEVLEEKFQVPDSGPIGIEGDQGKIEYRRIRIADYNLRATNKTESWRFETTADGKGSMKAEGDAITFVTSETSGENWHVQAYQAGLKLEEGADYKVTFEIKSPESKTVLLVAQINEEDWHEIGLHEEIYASKDWSKEEISFTAQDIVNNKNRIGFILGEEKGSVSIKNMKLIKQ